MNEPISAIGHCCLASTFGRGSFGAREAAKNFKLFGLEGKIDLVGVELNSAVPALKNGQVDGFATAGSYPAPNVGLRDLRVGGRTGASGARPAGSASASVRVLVRIASTITPPVCGTVFIAAGMMETPWIPVAGQAMRLGVGLYLVPLAFIANPALVYPDLTPWLAAWEFLKVAQACGSSAEA